MEYCDVLRCNVSILVPRIKGGIPKYKMLMPMKEFSEEVGVCKRGGGSLETLQQLSPVRIPSTATPPQNLQHNLSPLQPRSQVFGYSYVYL